MGFCQTGVCQEEGRLKWSDQMKNWKELKMFILGQKRLEDKIPILKSRKADVNRGSWFILDGGGWRLAGNTTVEDWSSREMEFSFA